MFNKCSPLWREDAPIIFGRHVCLFLAIFEPSRFFGSGVALETQLIFYTLPGVSQTCECWKNIENDSRRGTFEGGLSGLVSSGPAGKIACQIHMLFEHACATTRAYHFVPLRILNLLYPVLPRTNRVVPLERPATLDKNIGKPEPNSHQAEGLPSKCINPEIHSSPFTVTEMVLGEGERWRWQWWRQVIEV